MTSPTGPYFRSRSTVTHGPAFGAPRQPKDYPTPELYDQAVREWRAYRDFCASAGIKPVEVQTAYLTGGEVVGQYSPPGDARTGYLEAIAAASKVYRGPAGQAGPERSPEYRGEQSSSYHTPLTQRLVPRP